MLDREIIDVCSETHTKHINTLCGLNVELLNVNTFTAIVDFSRSNFSIARAPLFQLKSAT